MAWLPPVCGLVESGWQTHGSNAGDPLDGFPPPSYGSPSVSSLYQDLRHSWVGFQTLSTLKFGSLDTHTGGRKTSLAPSYAAPPGPLWRNPP